MAEATQAFQQEARRPGVPRPEPDGAQRRSGPLASGLALGTMYAATRGVPMPLLFPAGQFPRHEVTVVPYHTIAFSQQKLRAALRRAAEQDSPFTYGFVVHSRRHNEYPTLGIITLNGESLVLNERLIRALDGIPLWLFGHARIVMGVGAVLACAEGGRTSAVDLPLASMLMNIATFDTNAGVTQHLVQVEAVVKAERLVQPLLILTQHRPPAFPL